jgi:AcrR family transcriptional regulator
LSTSKKKGILEAATRSFGTFGYKATTMSQIAKQANVGKGTIYTFFKNKEELFDEIINNLILDMKNVADNAIQDADSFVAKVHNGIEAMMEFQKEHDLPIKLLQEQRELGTIAVHDALNRLNNAIVQYIKREIEESIERNEIVQCDSEITAVILYRLYTTLTIEWRRDHEPLDKQRVTELFNFYILNGLSK